MRTTPNQKQKSSRKGSVVVLSAVMMIFLVGLLAFGVDLGLAYVSRAELQRSADAAAISAAYDLLDQQLENPFDPPSDTLARATAIDFARRNSVANGSPTVPDADIEIGFLASPSGSISSGVGTSNAVRVTVKKTQLVNGETPFFFAQVFGHTGIQQQKSSTAAFVSAFGGFAAPSDGGNLEILPFALDSDTWDALLNSETTDDWTWNADTETVEPGVGTPTQVRIAGICNRPSPAGAKSTVDLHSRQGCRTSKRHHGISRTQISQSRSHIDRPDIGTRPTPCDDNSARAVLTLIFKVQRMAVFQRNGRRAIRIPRDPGRQIHCPNLDKQCSYEHYHNNHTWKFTWGE